LRPEGTIGALCALRPEGAIGALCALRPCGANLALRPLGAGCTRRRVAEELDAGDLVLLEDVVVGDAGVGAIVEAHRHLQPTESAVVAHAVERFDHDQRAVAVVTVSTIAAVADEGRAFHLLCIERVVAIGVDAILQPRAPRAALLAGPFRIHGSEGVETFGACGAGRAWIAFGPWCALVSRGPGGAGRPSCTACTGCAVAPVTDVRRDVDLVGIEHAVVVVVEAGVDALAAVGAVFSHGLVALLSECARAEVADVITEFLLCPVALRDDLASFGVVLASLQQHRCQ
jgi:hypothetical protein